MRRTSGVDKLYCQLLHVSQKLSCALYQGRVYFFLICILYYLGWKGQYMGTLSLDLSHIVVLQYRMSVNFPLPYSCVTTKRYGETIRTEGRHQKHN